MLTYCTLDSQLRGDARMALSLADQCIPLAREQKFGLWYLWPSALKAWALSELGRPQEGLMLMRQVLELWKQSGILAGMHLNLGRGEFLEAIRFAREHEMHAYEQRAQASLRHSLQELREEAPMHP